MLVSSSRQQHFELCLMNTLMMLLSVIVCFLPRHLLSGRTRANIVMILIFVHAVVANVVDKYVFRLDLGVLTISSTLVSWSVSFPILLIAFCSNHIIQIPVYAAACYISYKNYWYLYEMEKHHYPDWTDEEADSEISMYVFVYIVVATSVSTITRH